MNISMNSKVSEVVKFNYNTAQIFEENNIDFCCGGNISVEKACIKAGVNAEILMELLTNAIFEDDYGSRYIDQLSLDKLSDYIQERHHAYVNAKLPFLLEKLTKLKEVHGNNHPELKEVYELFKTAAGNLAIHMKKEELILFPYIKRMVKYRAGEMPTDKKFGGIMDPIHVMELEHQAEGDRFKRIREITSNYTVPADGCNTYMVAFNTLRDFENDLHRHIHLENNILFPKALTMEKDLI